MKPMTAANKVIDLEDAVSSWAEATELCWEMGIAGIMRSGKSREEAEAELGEVWHRCSLAWERRWKGPTP